MHSIHSSPRKVHSTRGQQCSVTVQFKRPLKKIPPSYSSRGKEALHAVSSVVKLDVTCVGVTVTVTDRKWLH